MSATAVRDVVRRSMADEGYRDLLASDFEAAVASLDLTDAERAAIASGDEEAIFEAAGRRSTAPYVIHINHLRL